MNKGYTNLCMRCGKERIFSRTWKEDSTTFSGATVEIVYTEFVCPDKDCQKIVNEKLTVEREKREAIQSDKEQRAKDNILKRGGLRISSKK